MAALQRYLGDAAGQGYVKAFPGIGTHVPLYILGSSTESAYLAAEKGLPYVFAAHFAPRMLEEALAIYRSRFRPSETLAQPYAIVALNVIGADDDQAAQYLATSQQQFFSTWCATAASRSRRQSTAWPGAGTRWSNTRLTA